MTWTATETVALSGQTLDCRMEAEKVAALARTGWKRCESDKVASVATRLGLGTRTDGSTYDWVNRMVELPGSRRTPSAVKKAPWMAKSGAGNTGALTFVHCRSVVAVGAWLSNWVRGKSHSGLSRVHTRFEDAVGAVDWYSRPVQIVKLVHCVLLVGVHAAEANCEAGQVEQFWHCVSCVERHATARNVPGAQVVQLAQRVSEVALQATLINCPARQTAQPWHCRFCVPLQGTVSTCCGGHTVQLAQTRSVVAVTWIAVYFSPGVHCVVLAQTRSLVLVGAVCWNCSVGTHCVRLLHTRSVVAVGPAA